jgi:hypothetical protein
MPGDNNRNSKADRQNFTTKSWSSMSYNCVDDKNDPKRYQVCTKTVTKNVNGQESVEETIQRLPKPSNFTNNEEVNQGVNTF